MFFAQRPSAARIERFLSESQTLPLSYTPVGIVRHNAVNRRFDEETVVIGRGQDDFERARAALTRWVQFDIGWVELHPRGAPIEPGTVVAVLIRHFGFWSLNGCRVVYDIAPRERECHFGFAYGTLTNHAESGEELFEVFLDPGRDQVIYRIRATSWPQTMLTRVGQPIVRVLQRRFRRDSVAAMQRALKGAARTTS